MRERSHPERTEKVEHSMSAVNNNAVSIQELSNKAIHKVKLKEIVLLSSKKVPQARESLVPKTIQF